MASLRFLEVGGWSDFRKAAKAVTDLARSHLKVTVTPGTGTGAWLGLHMCDSQALWPWFYGYFSTHPKMLVGGNVQIFLTWPHRTLRSHFYWL